jgi:hypothetical protein
MTFPPETAYDKRNGDAFGREPSVVLALGYYERKRCADWYCGVVVNY